MKIKMVYLIILMVLLAACEARISTEVYMGDLAEIEDEGELTTAVVIGLYIPSQDDCAEYRQRYQDVFRKSKGFKGMEYVRCYSEGSDHFAEYELEVPMRMVDPSSTAMKGTFEIIRHDDAATQSRNLYLRSKPSALCDLDDLISDEFWQSLDLTGTSPQITITNDLREPQTLILDHVFVNGSSVVETKEFTLDRRDSIEVALSNVTSAWVFDKSCNISSRMALVATWADST